VLILEFNKDWKLSIFIKFGSFGFEALYNKQTESLIYINPMAAPWGNNAFSKRAA